MLVKTAISRTIDGVRRQANEEFDLDLPPAEIDELRQLGILAREPAPEPAPEPAALVEETEAKPARRRR
ncbi:hypothetical protein O4H52_07910 [Sphingomonadaceae bacterium G21617-S1]|nr:hypothetical protein [Sphingomonadaceae bacterium G21617-S1]